MFTFLKNTKGEKKSADPGNKLWILLIVAVAGLLLIFIGNGTKEVKAEESPSPYRTESDEIVIYRQHLEERVKAICESVRGVRGVTVTLSLSGGFESVYATEWKDGNEEYVILGSGASAEPLYLYRSAPEITGIGVVCSGAENEYVRYELISLLSAAFHVNANRIYVTRAKAEGA